MTGTFEIVSLNVSESKGTPKRPVGELVLVEDSGILGDAHAGPGKRQVSLLAAEDIEAFGASSRGAQPAVAPGDFAENITTRGVDLPSLPLGTRLSIGEAVLEVSQIGKECHSSCAIRERTGDCAMPRRGVFARVIVGGRISRESPCSYGL